MRIDLAFPALPPALNGIGDYTALLAAELATRHVVRVLTAQADAAPIHGVEVVEVGIPGVTSGATPGAMRAGPLLGAVAAAPPDWLIVQYNPFSYGRWGLNLRLPWALQGFRASHPRSRLAVMVHEPFVPVDGWKNAAMTTWQRAQLAALVRAADLVFVSTEQWAQHFARWFPATPVHALPVGSNIPEVPGPPDATMRRRIGIGEHEVVLGLFGSAHPSRLLAFIRTAAETVAESGHAVRVLYVGPHGVPVREALAPIPILDAGPLPAASVSHHFRAMDLYLAPFRKGVSERRGSFMAGLQHGIATVSTQGKHTGPALRCQDGKAFLLAPDRDATCFAQHALALVADPARRAAIGHAGRVYFEHAFSWARIAADLESKLSDGSRGVPVSSPAVRATGLLASRPLRPRPTRV
ncbi:MAG: glycosyltransferase family 4 protein [Rhodothermaceae bacterium]|nr:glycosyltransferase family 4 protein [Rhodothermaceae bacterium]